jgi:hypothetical protein
MDDIDQLAALRLSFHEASHVCVARALLGPHAQISVTIRSQNNGTGTTSYGNARTSARNAIVMAASGRAGEQILLRLHDDCFEGEADGDERKIKQIQRDHGLSDDEVEVARAQARMLVRSHAAEIRILGGQLLQAGRGVHKIQ